MAGDRGLLGDYRAQKGTAWGSVASSQLCSQRENIQAALGEMRTLKQENENQMSGGEPQAPILLQGAGGLINLASGLQMR